MNQRYEEFKHDCLAQKCLSFRLGIEIGNMDPSLSPLPHPDSLFEVFKVDPTKFAEQAKPRLVSKLEGAKEDFEVNFSP